MLLVTDHDPNPRRIFETGPRRTLMLLRSEACLAGLHSHVTRDLQHLIHQRAQGEVRAQSSDLERAEARVEYTLPVSPRASRRSGRSPMQETPTSSYTIVRRIVSTKKSHGHSSHKKGSYREPSTDNPDSAVDQAPSGRFKGTVIATFGGGPDIQPSDLPARITVPRRYDQDPGWRDFLERTDNQRPDEVEVFNKPPPRRDR